MIPIAQEVEDVNFWSPYPINWPALCTLAALVVILIGLQFRGDITRTLRSCA